MRPRKHGEKLLSAGVIVTAYQHACVVSVAGSVTGEGLSTGLMLPHVGRHALGVEAELDRHIANRRKFLRRKSHREEGKIQALRRYVFFRGARGRQGQEGKNGLVIAMPAVGVEGIGWRAEEDIAVESIARFLFLHGCQKGALRDA